MSNPVALTLDTEAIAPFLEPKHFELAESITAFCGETIAPLGHLESDDDARLRARELLTLLGDAGWCRYAVPEEFGGAEDSVDFVACCLIRDALAAVSPLADSVFALQCLGSLPIALHGTSEVQETWLPKVANGTAMAGFAMTEADAGSDVKSIETTAARVEAGAGTGAVGDYVLDGRKHFITNAGLADFYSTFARNEGGGGLTGFVVPAATDGFRFVTAQVLSAPHPLGEIAFETCRVPEAFRLGDDGEGFEIGIETLSRLRATVAAAACGMAARALAEAREHALHRKQFGKSLSRFQIIQQKLAVMATDLAASRLMTYRAARAAANGERNITLCSAMAKFHASEAAQRIVDQAVQILGGAGVLASHPVDHLYRSVRALRIYEGTSEIQQLVIARELLNEP